MVEFPKALYRGDECLIVEDKDQEAAARVGGFRFWSDPDDEERAPEQAPESSGDAVTVEGLRAMLDAAGIAYDRRWGVEKLQAALQ